MLTGPLTAACCVALLVSLGSGGTVYTTGHHLRYHWWLRNAASFQLARTVHHGGLEALPDQDDVGCRGLMGRHAIFHCMDEVSSNGGREG